MEPANRANRTGDRDNRQPNEEITPDDQTAQGLNRTVSIITAGQPTGGSVRDNVFVQPRDAARDGGEMANRTVVIMGESILPTVRPINDQMEASADHLRSRPTQPGITAEKNSANGSAEPSENIASLVKPVPVDPMQKHQVKINKILAYIRRHFEIKINFDDEYLKVIDGCNRLCLQQKGCSLIVLDEMDKVAFDEFFISNQPEIQKYLLGKANTLGEKTTVTVEKLHGHPDPAASVYLSTDSNNKAGQKNAAPVREAMAADCHASINERSHVHKTIEPSIGRKAVYMNFLQSAFPKLKATVIERMYGILDVESQVLQNNVLANLSPKAFSDFVHQRLTIREPLTEQKAESISGQHTSAEGIVERWFIDYPFIHEMQFLHKIRQFEHKKTRKDIRLYNVVYINQSANVQETIVRSVFHHPTGKIPHYVLQPVTKYNDASCRFPLTAVTDLSGLTGFYRAAEVPSTVAILEITPKEQCPVIDVNSLTISEADQALIKQNRCRISGVILRPETHLRAFMDTSTIETIRILDISRKTKVHMPLPRFIYGDQLVKKQKTAGTIQYRYKRVKVLGKCLVKCPFYSRDDFHANIFCFGGPISTKLAQSRCLGGSLSILPFSESTGIQREYKCFIRERGSWTRVKPEVLVNDKTSPSQCTAATGSSSTMAKFKDSTFYLQYQPDKEMRKDYILSLSSRPVNKKDFELLCLYTFNIHFGALLFDSIIRHRYQDPGM